MVRLTYEIFPGVTPSRLQGDFYVNQIFLGHGTFGGHQARLFRRIPRYFLPKWRKLYQTLSKVRSLESRERKVPPLFPGSITPQSLP